MAIRVPPRRSGFVCRWVALPSSWRLSLPNRAVRRRPRAARVADERASGRSLLRYLAGTFVLTLSNPSTILSFIAVFGVLAGRAPAASASPWAMVSGVLVGSALWWLLLSTGVGLLRERFDARWQRAINLCSAAMLAGLALWQLVQLLP